MQYRLEVSRVKPPETPASVQIADYELVRLIGRGSYGDVWLARSVTGAFRAVKFVWRDRFEDLRPYEREFEGITRFTAVSLREPSQLALLHVGRDPAASYFYYVMELADDATSGRDIDPEKYVPLTLREVRERRGRLPAGEVVALGVSLARALASLHTAGLVHRDIKPSNIVFVGGVPKLADVGLVAAASAGLTFVGTEGFVPPEGPGAPSADVFSLGKVLYELATGLDRHDYPRLPNKLGELPDRKELLELNEVLIRACEPNASNRFSDAAALLDELLLLQAGKSVRRLRNAEKRIARTLRVAAVLALVAGLAGAGAWVEHARAAKAEAERDDVARKSVYSAGVARAQRKLEVNDLGRARRLLQEIAPKAGEPDLRDFEWHALWREAQGDPADVLRESGAMIAHVRYSPDGRFIAVQSYNQVVTLYDATTHSEIRRIEQIQDMAGFSTDSRWLVGAKKRVGNKQELQRWSVSTGEPDVQPAPDSNRPLAAIGNDRAVSFVDQPRDAHSGISHFVRVWDFSQHAETARILVPVEANGARWDFLSAAVSPDGSRIALALILNNSQTARWRLAVWDLATQSLVVDRSTPRGGVAMAFCPKSGHLAVAFVDSLRILEIPSATTIWENKVGVTTQALAFSPDGTQLAFGSSAPDVQFFAAKDGQFLARLRGHDAGVKDIIWSPSGSQITSGGNAGDVRVWSPDVTATPTFLTANTLPTTSYSSACFCDDGSLLATGNIREGVAIVETSTLKKLSRLDTAFKVAAFDTDQLGLWTIDREGGLQHWDWRNARLIQQQHLPSKAVPRCVAVSIQHGLLVSGDTEGILYWWSLSDGKLIAQSHAHAGIVWDATFTPDGRFLISTGQDRRIRLWSTKDRHELAYVKLLYDCYCIDVSADGTKLAAAAINGRIEVRDTERLQLDRAIPTDNSRLSAVLFSRSGSQLWVAGSSGDVSAYATGDWREIVDLTTRNAYALAAQEVAAVDWLATDSRSSLLAAHLSDGRIRLWRR